MARDKIEIKGLDSAIKDLKKLGKTISIPIKSGITKATKKCQKRAKLLCPVDKGALRNSINTEIRAKAEGVAGEVGTNLEYAACVEYGTGPTGNGTYPYTIKGISLNYKADKWKGNIPNVGIRWISGQKAQPYMYPAYAETKEELPKILKEECDKVLRGRKN